MSASNVSSTPKVALSRETTTNAKDHAKDESKVDMLAAAVRTILEHTEGEDPDRDGLQGTPHRFARAFEYFTEGYTKTAKDAVADAIFEVDHEEMVVLRDIDVHSLCEHHLIPFFGKAHIAYLPDPKRGVVGLSKLARLTEVFARRLQVQERLTRQIMEALDDLLKPMGVAVILECRHLCMEMRGVQKVGSVTVTSTSSGLFKTDPAVWAEFVALSLRTDDPSKATADDTLSACGCDFISGSSVQVASTESSKQEGMARDASSNAEDLILYQKCAKAEYSIIVDIIREALTGPITEKNRGGLSILDIGAGNGLLLSELSSAIGPTNISLYVAFEQDTDLAADLKLNVARLGFDSKSVMIRADSFTKYTSVDEAADIVLLCHSLYGATYARKNEVIMRALDCVAPGGVVLIFHRWVPGGTVDRLCDDLVSRSILHQVRIVDFQLDLSDIDARERRSMSAYTKGNVSADNECSSVTRTMGCIAIEPHSCDLSNAQRVEAAVDSARMRVSHIAREKEPAAVVTPMTVVGIQACLRAASLQHIGSGKVTVIGGGHSGNCLANGAIAICMKSWDLVVVDPLKSTVRVGGGATVGMITSECEKHGLVVPLGDRPGVGMGLILQGGLNHFMRSLGLACDRLLCVTYINSTGELQIAQTQDDLFPFRGAGTNFGVVLEVTLRASRLESVVAQDTVYLFSDDEEHQVLTQYSQAAVALPNEACLDGYLFWSSPNRLAFATTYFDTSRANNDVSSCLLSLDSETKVIQGTSKAYKPSALFDRELYMTEFFDPKSAQAVGTPAPNKLRSLKRCLLFSCSNLVHENILFHAVRLTPSKWCYVHILHGGGEAGKADLAGTAFGCRDWDFAAVLTARWPDGDSEVESAVMEWLDRCLRALLPHAVGVYPSDIGPSEHWLARSAFGTHGPFLADLKRKSDPLNVFGCGCPLIPETLHNDYHDPYIQEGAVVIFCGRRCSGKDWLASVTEKTLRRLIQDGDGTELETVRISDAIKREYAAENPGVDPELLIRDRQYKETHRKGIAALYEKRKSQNVAFDAECFVNITHNAASSILLLTGMRDGLDYARSLAGRRVVLVKVCSTEESRGLRGWSPISDVDGSAGECAADSMKDSFWDLMYQNGLESSTQSAEDWVLSELAPTLLKSCTRRLPDTPQPRIVFKDVVGSLLLEPFGLPLCSALFVNWLQRATSDEVEFDAIVAPEALGFVFASPVASVLKKPLVLVRQQGKLPGAVHKVSYNGSNMSNLRNTSEQQLGPPKKCCFEVISGAIKQGQRILIIDDCLATGATVDALARLISDQGGDTKLLACVMELPDLRGRDVADQWGIRTFSLMRFSGK